VADVLAAATVSSKVHNSKKHRSAVKMADISAALRAPASNYDITMPKERATVYFERVDSYPLSPEAHPSKLNEY